MPLGKGRATLAMGHDRHLIHPRRHGLLFAGLCAVALMLAAADAAAQGTVTPSPPPQTEESPDFFSRIFHWFGRQADNFNSNLKDAGSQVNNFGREAGIAARSTVDAAKDAAGAVVRIPNTRVINGHEKCAVAPNGAPDCVTAANKICKAKGFESGKSLDMTTAEVCPPKVLLSGRNSPSECHDETFVSRALCQ